MKEETSTTADDINKSLDTLIKELDIIKSEYAKLYPNDVEVNKLLNNAQKELIFTHFNIFLTERKIKHEKELAQ